MFRVIAYQSGKRNQFTAGAFSQAVASEVLRALLASGLVFGGYLERA
jgi:hypothetical protein